MKSIENNITNEIIINKSRFICCLFKIEDDIEKYLNEVKLKYKDATHYCYAYIDGNVKRFNDDKEPSGTAGMPILNVLESNELNILAVVIRYFGGIKLGAGGLVRAYTKAVTSALEQSHIISLELYTKLSITFKYDDIKKIDYLLTNTIIYSKEFNNNITYVIGTKKDNLNNLLNSLKTYINDYNILNDVYEKED